VPTRRTHRGGGESRIGSRPAGMGGRWWQVGWTAVVVATTVWLVARRAGGRGGDLCECNAAHAHTRTHAHERYGERAHAHRQLGTDFCTSKRHRVYYNTLLEKPTTLLLLLPLVLLLLLLLPPHTRSLTHTHAVRSVGQTLLLLFVCLFFRF